MNRPPSPQPSRRWVVPLLIVVVLALVASGVLIYLTAPRLRPTGPTVSASQMETMFPAGGSFVGDATADQGPIKIDPTASYSLCDQYLIDAFGQGVATRRATASEWNARVASYPDAETAWERWRSLSKSLPQCQSEVKLTDRPKFSKGEPASFQVTRERKVAHLVVAWGNTLTVVTLEGGRMSDRDYVVPEVRRLIDEAAAR